MSFIASVHSDYLPFVDIATDDELAQFIRAQISYARGEAVPELTGMAKALFDVHMALMARLGEASAKKSEAGKKGGAPAGNQNAKKQPKTTGNNQEQAEVEIKQPCLKKNKPITETISFTETDTMENQNTCAQEPRTSAPDNDIPQAENSPTTGDGAREQQHGDSGNNYTAEFETFWEAYPRRVRKPDAFKAWRARKKTGLPVSEVVLAAQTYAKAMAYMGRPPDKIMHPQTFINADRWRDWLPPDGPEYLGARQSAMSMGRSGGGSAPPRASPPRKNDYNAIVTGAGAEDQEVTSP